MLESLLTAASGYFAGDPWAPGVQLAWIEKNREFYGALHRYQKAESGPPKRVVVCKFIADDMSKTIIGLAIRFQEIIERAVKSRNALATALDGHLRDDDEEVVYKHPLNEDLDEEWDT